MNVTINELSRKTGISTYEIRHRIKNGNLPYIRVGTKQTKILINEDVFNDMLIKESVSNAASNSTIAHDTYDTIGYGRLRKLD